MAAKNWSLLILSISIVVNVVLSNPVDETDGSSGPVYGAYEHDHDNNETRPPPTPHEDSEPTDTDTIRRNLLNKLKEMESLLKKFETAHDVNAENQLNDKLRGVLDFIWQFKQEILGLSGINDIVVHIEIFRLLMHCHETNVLTKQNEKSLEMVYPILKDIVEKVASLKATDERAIEFFQSYGGTFKVLFALLDLLKQPGAPNIKHIALECEKVHRKINLFIDPEERLPDVHFSPDILEKLSELKTELENKIHVFSGEQQVEDLLENLKKQPLYDQIHRIQTVNHDVLHTLQTDREKVADHTHFRNYLETVDINALTSNTITHILEKDLGFTDTHSSPEREAIIRKLLIRLDSPNGLGIYKFNDNKRLLNEVRGKMQHLEKEQETEPQIKAALPKYSHYGMYFTYFFDTIGLQRKLHHSIKNANLSQQLSIWNDLELNIQIAEFSEKYEKNFQATEDSVQLQKIQDGIAERRAKLPNPPHLMNINLSPEFTRKLAEIERQLIMDHSDGDEQKRPLLQKYHSFYV